MENIYGNFNYNRDFIEGIQSQIDLKIAEYSRKKNNNRKYNISFINKDNGILQLQNYKNILEQIIYCNSCFQSIKIEDVIQKTKSLLK